MDSKDIMNKYGIPAMPRELSEAMAYVPFQPYDPDMSTAVKGYENGTIYCALYKPFYGGKCGGKDDD